MQTRIITNSGHPLQDIAGNLLTDTTITFELVDVNSTPAGAFDSNGEYIAPGPYSINTDENGVFSITLPCSDGLVDQRFYICTINHPDCPEFMAPLTYSADPLTWVDFMGSGTTPPAAVVDPFTRHMQNTEIHTPAGSTHNHLISVVASVAIGGHRVITMSGEYADCDNPAHGSAIAGVTLQAVSAGQPLDAQYLGEMEELSWHWTLNQPVYLGTLGQLTQIPPETGILIEIGRPITATKLLIDIQPTLYL